MCCIESHPAQSKTSPTRNAIRKLRIKPCSDWWSLGKPLRRIGSYIPAVDAAGRIGGFIATSLNSLQIDEYVGPIL
jgi:hypothetical protein